MKSIKRLANFVFLILLPALALAGSAMAEPARVVLRGHVPGVVPELTPKGRSPATNNLRLAIGLPLRNEAVLDGFLTELYDRHSADFHKFLTPPEFTERFGPTEEDYQAVIRFAEAGGLRIAGTHSNRVVLEVEGSVSNVERAFGVTLRIYRHPSEPRDFFAPDAEPSVPANLPVADMWGLSDYGLPRPLSHKVDPLKISPLNYNGSGPGGAYQGRDFRNAYVPGASLTGAGQILAVAEFDGYYPSDITSYEGQCGYTNVPLQNVLLDGVSGTPGYSGAANAVAEVSLDIETALAMAPGLSKIMVYEGSSPYTVFNKIATDNLAKQVSCSWAFSVGPTHTWIRHSSTSTLDSQLKQMAAQGQSFFQASGDSDAYTGSQALSSSSGPIPVDSVYVTSVGGTTLNMSGTGASWSSETVWNWGNNTGSGGGISPNYALPSWQTNVSMAANSGSTVNRNIPDVALTADAVEVVYNNGSSGAFGGTSCAAPLWAGLCALVNQQSVAGSGTTVGFLNPAIYAIAGSNNYTNCFHDITTGNNIGSHTPGLFNAVPGYDLCTGLGTPNGANLINALAPPAFPYFITQPAGRIVTNGASLTFSATVAGQSPLSYQWLFDGTNLPAGGNASGTTSNVLSITAATTNNSGNYQIVASNNFGSVTSSVAVLAVGFPPAFSTQPANLTIVAGSNAIFSAAVNGSTPLAYQWRKNGTSLVNGAGISGATTDSLTLTGVTTNSSGSYTLAVTNLFGRSTSSVAALTVVLPPTITSSLANQTIECGSNVTFNVTASGTTPLNFQWSLDGTPISGATNTGLALTNVHLPNHTVTLVVTNLYGSATSNAVLAVHDTTAPVMTLNGINPLFIELGAIFTDPGATANDTCADVVSVVATGAVNTNAVGTNTVVYTANDGNGNTATASRAVIVRDTTPPAILWSFTNLTMVAGTNCSARMPDVTGSNFIVATDLSGALRIFQTPTNNAPLPPGTNLVVITVQDASSNAAYSTNIVIVQDQTPPVITLNGGNPLFIELGAVFTDPGATANDTCAGVVPVLASGMVNTNAVGTNSIVYIANDGNGNTATVSRTVIVRDTTPPTILWSFTNLTLAADTNCSARMPDVTGTNFIVATDSSGALTIFQNPTINALLPLGTNLVLITVRDASSNAAYSTNIVFVQRQTPPVITLNGRNPLFTELGAIFVDPGATATDTCASVVSVTVSGAVNTNVVGTNTVVYTANDGTGNTATASRTVIVRDTTPPAILWSFTNLTLAAGTNCSAGMPDVTGTNFIVATDLSGALTIFQTPTNNAKLLVGTNLVVITVQDASSNAAYSTNFVIVSDQTPPVVTLNGNNPLFIELGAIFTDPGAAAYDTCAGVVSVLASGAVNINAVGANSIVYTANDGNGNTATVLRSVIVRDTTPPAILWSFTNLTLATDTNCSAQMPDVTGTNSIVATDLSGALTIFQTPTNNAPLPLGTSLVVITVQDASGNPAYSTNTVIVSDQMPPVILSPPQNQTNLAGATTVFEAIATACTPLTYQWLFNDTVLTTQTNSTFTIGSVSPTNAGNYSVVATASGGSTTSAVATLTVNLNSTSLALDSTANPSGYKDNLKLSAVISPANALGTIQFLTNGAVFDSEAIIGGQTTSTNLASLPRGTNLITAIYSGDANDLRVTNTIAQVVTNHPPVAATAFYNRPAGSSLSIAVADLATNWTDVDGDALSLADFSVSTNGITLTTNAGTLVYSNSNDVPDQFVCTISDGWGGTNFQTVNIAIVPTVSSTPLIRGVTGNGDGTFTLNLAGAPGYTYVLEARTNLNPPGSWLPVTTNTLGTNGLWLFNDAQATNFQQRFYRLKLVP